MKKLDKTAGGLVKPAALEKGQTIGLVAPASPCWTEHGIERAKEYLERLGYRVAVAPHCRDSEGYLAGSDADRAGDLNDFFADPAVDAIFCIRGGYGALRMAEYLDFNAIASNPKIFAGYSDITVLHAAFRKNCGFVTFHAPMPVSDMIADFSEFSLASFVSLLDGSASQTGNPAGYPLDAVCPGEAEGELCGGNLSLVAATIGTPWELDTRGKILFLEDVDEEPYGIDRMLTQLRLAGKLDGCAGFLLGDWANCESKGSYRESPSAADVIAEKIRAAGKPALRGVCAGHCDPTLTLPFGVRASIDAASLSWSIAESPVTTRKA